METRTGSRCYEHLILVKSTKNKLGWMERGELKEVLHYEVLRTITGVSGVLSAPCALYKNIRN